MAMPSNIVVPRGTFDTSSVDESDDTSKWEGDNDSDDELTDDEQKKNKI